MKPWCWLSKDRQLSSCHCSLCGSFVSSTSSFFLLRWPDPSSGGQPFFDASSILTGKRKGPGPQEHSDLSSESSLADLLCPSPQLLP